MRWIKASDQLPDAEEKKRISIKYKSYPDVLIFIHGGWCWWDDSGSYLHVTSESWKGIEYLDETPSCISEDVADEFRLILSHAFLGCDTSDISKETWELAISECVKFMTSSDPQLLQEATSIIEGLKKENERLKGLLREVCVRANIIFPERGDELDWFDEQFVNQTDLHLNIGATLGLGEIDEEAIEKNKELLETIQKQFKK